MIDKSDIEKIEDEWFEGGFLDSLRNCNFDKEAYERLEHLLNTVREQEDLSQELISRDLVRLVWFIPQFMEWQIERVIEKGGDPKLVHSACSNIRELVGKILGEP